MKRTVIALSMIVGLLVGAAAAQAWWDGGHARITEGAIQHLPDQLQAYFAFNETYLNAQSGYEPPGKHYINIDGYPTFDPSDPYSVPRDEQELRDLYGDARVDSYGIGPWTTVGYVTQLTQEMSAATTAEDWTNLLETAAELAHYAGDMHNPLHLTRNYNGQLTDNDGIHARYEGDMVGRHLWELTPPPAPGSCVYVESPIDAVFDAVYVGYAFVQPIMDADNANRVGEQPPYTYDESYYAGMWADTGAFTQSQFDLGSRMLAGFWYTAWVNAGTPEPIYQPGEGDFDLDGDVDLTDFVGLQVCYTETSGSFVDYACPRVDFDGDKDVDNGDLAGFIAAINGPEGMTIAQVHAADLGTEVTVGGAVVTAVTDIAVPNGQPDVFLQDDTGALRVYGHRYRLQTLIYLVDASEKIRITGTVAEFNGMRVITSPLRVYWTKPGQMPLPIPTTAADYTDGSPTAEQLEGKLVSLPDATFVSGGSQFCCNCSQTVSTPSGDVQVWISCDSGLGSQPIPDGPVELIGIHNQNDESAPYDGDYRISPRSVDDLILVP